ncbi:MAG: DUF1573 domain-containing protein [Bacteroidetes bacterium]|nr:DUF1573 domain-containing protein [Bacteroidota bacterium]HET6245675.1 DUF1573 domain-containing protein [Bacteroidia bacterium]
MKENLKIGLLAVIAVTLVAHTVLQNKGSISESSKNQTATAATAHNPNDGGDHTGHDHGEKNPFNTETPQATEVNTGPVTGVAFAKSAHDFGKIKQDTKNTFKFKFTNTGNNPLIIENATGSCGCTVPEYPKEPIAPGAQGEITVEYSPGKQQGAQSKTVTITANTEPKQTMLTISANVEEVPVK